MDPRTGELYPTLKAAQDAGVDDAVEITGTEEAIKAISNVVHERYLHRQRKQKRRMAKASRKANRG